MFAKTLDGCGLSDAELTKLVALTSPSNRGGIGYSFSDLTLKALPEAVAESFPDKPLIFKILMEVLSKVNQTPRII